MALEKASRIGVAALVPPSASFAAAPHLLRLFFPVRGPVDAGPSVRLTVSPESAGQFVTSQEERTEAVSSGERRRSKRLRLGILVELEWTTEDGRRVRNRAVTEEVNIHGALLRITTRHELPAKLKLKNLRTKKSTDAETVWIARPAENGSTQQL